MKRLRDYIDYDPYIDGFDPSLLPTGEIATVRLPKVLVLQATLTGIDADRVERIMRMHHEDGGAFVRRLIDKEVCELAFAGMLEEVRCD